MGSSMLSRRLSFFSFSSLAIPRPKGPLRAVDGTSALEGRANSVRIEDRPGPLQRLPPAWGTGPKGTLGQLVDIARPGRGGPHSIASLCWFPRPKMVMKQDGPRGVVSGAETGWGLFLSSRLSPGPIHVPQVLYRLVPQGPLSDYSYFPFSSVIE